MPLRNPDKWRKHQVCEGDRFGHLIAIESIDVNVLSNVEVKCTHCEDTYEVSYSRLLVLRRWAADGRATRCPSCAQGKARKILGWCSVCADLPWRRPIGKLCRCGKRYEEERVDPVPAPSPKSCLDWVM